MISGFGVPSASHGTVIELPATDWYIGFGRIVKYGGSRRVEFNGNKSRYMLIRKSLIEMKKKK